MFNFKICRSCGEIFEGQSDICDSCTSNFKHLELELKSSEYKDYLNHCKYCGRPYLKIRKITRNTKSGTQSFMQETRKVYCSGIANDDIHYCQCQNCGKAIKVSTSGGNWPNKLGCSKRCTQLIKEPKKRATSLERYGTEVPAQSKEVRAKMEATTEARYGVKCYLQKGSTRDIADQKMREKYNVEKAVSQNPEIRKKITDTVTKNYGGYTFASPELSARVKQTMIDTYGDAVPLRNPEILDKLKKTNLERYGSECVLTSQHYKDKVNSETMEKYGVMWPTQRPEVIESRTKTIVQSYANTIQDPIKRLNYLQFYENPTAYIVNHFDHKPTIYEVSQSLDGFDEATIYAKLGRDASTELLSRSVSRMEEEIVDFLSSYIDKDSICIHDRRHIGKQEIDIFLPNHNVGIECNPTETHNSTRKYMDICDIMNKNYHKNKTNACIKSDIFLFHVFGYEWIWKKPIIKSMILSTLGIYESKFYARKLHVVEINHYECKMFLSQNHRQGYTNASVRIGLKTPDGILVSVMTFNKTRKTIGWKKDDTENSWELSRFCTLLNTSVVGGASKLFQYFIRNYTFDKIISYSDRAHTRGTLYNVLGFHQVSLSEPDYVWVNYYDHTYKSRVSCQKKNLPKLFNEPDLDIENQTEKQIMASHGFVQVFDSGVIRWEYINKLLRNY